MTTGEHSTPDELNLFEKIVAPLIQEGELPIQYHERDGYYSISLADDFAMLRNAYSDHIHALYDAAQGEVLPDEYYDIVERNLNTRDSEALYELHKGDIIGTISDVTFFAMDFASGGPIDCQQVTVENALVGVFHRIIIAPIPSGTMGDEGLVVETRDYEPMIILLKPAIEDASGELHGLGDPFVCVPFFDASIRFRKRQYQERSL